MKLQDTLPTHVTVGRRRYRIDADFRNVLRMMDALSDSTLTGEARCYVALRCVMQRPPRRRQAAVLAAVEAALFDDAPARNGKRLTSFEQDADLIRAAFMQNYGVNLWRDKLHWLEFTALLRGLPEGSRYAEILGIRARPIPSPTRYNKQERDWLIKAKRECALKLTDEEIARDYNSDVGNIFHGLLAMAGDKNG